MFLLKTMGQPDKKANPFTFVPCKSLNSIPSNRSILFKRIKDKKNCRDETKY